MEGTIFLILFLVLIALAIIIPQLQRRRSGEKE